VKAQSSPSGQFFCRRTIALFLAQTKQRLRNRFQDEQWQLGLINSSSHTTEKAVAQFKELTPPKGKIWADPHVVEHDDKTYVFFEELQHRENKGRIAAARLTPEGFEHPPEVVLDETHHLSYPHVFKHNQAYYMIPETAAKQTISLYKSSAFPHGWEKLGDIMNDIDAADTTVLQHGGIWWLFTNGMSHPSVDERDQLLLFYAEDLHSAHWQPHPLNPIVTGVDRARMGGPIYEKNNTLFRVSQYGANRYGYGVNISRIQHISKTDYQETLISRLTPKPDSQWIGCHTAVHTDKIILIDRLRRTRKTLRS